MDQRRFFAFLLLSFGVLMLAQVLFPPPLPPEPAGNDPAVAQLDGDNGQLIEEDAAGSSPGAAAIVEEEINPEAEEVESAASDTQLLALGSVDPESGYRLLVTLSSDGAAVHRIELANPRYRDLTDRSGYLGHITESLDAQVSEEPASGLMDTSGVDVQVVGAGTPAALAGIEPGDRIVGIAGKKPQAIHSLAELTKALRKTTPGTTIELEVVRQGGAKETVAVKLGRRPLEVLRPEIENLVTRKSKKLAAFEAPDSFLLKLGKVSEEDKSLTSKPWKVAEANKNSVTFKRELAGQQVELIKRYTLKAVPEEMRDNVDFPGYDLDLEVEIRNLSEEPKAVNYTLSGPNGLPIEGWWYAHKISHGWSAAGLRDVLVRYYDSPIVQNGCSKIADDKIAAMGQGESLAYAAVDSQYFAVAMLPQKESAENVWFEQTEAIRVGPKPDKATPKTYTNVSFNLERQVVQIPAGESLRDSYRIFAGPKRPELLKQYYPVDQKGYSLSDIVYYGWFGSVAKLMLSALHIFYGIVGNYGIAIVLLTLLVRGCMFPLSYKQTKNMSRMQELKPELDKINEKYKNDAQKKQQAMAQLYSKHQINPLSGCLPLFIQLPVFMGLYRGLMIDIELRQSALFSDSIKWCSNLAAPDMFLNWSSFMPSAINNGVGIFGLGPYLNVLPLVSVSLFLVSQKMFMPPPTNDQAAMQQSMMKYMTLFMGLIFYKVAAGLCIYLIVSSLWGIVERKLLPKANVGAEVTTAGTSAKASPASAPAKPAKAASANGSPKKNKKKKAKRKK